MQEMTMIDVAEKRGEIIKRLEGGAWLAASMRSTRCAIVNFSLIRVCD
jgi:hypothetical protein